MKEYFLLQYRIFSRKIEEAGVTPLVGWPFAIVIFVGISMYLFSKTAFAGYLYALIPISLMLRLSGRRRNDFLKNTFDKKDYYKMRVVENLIIAFPFLLFLIFKQAFWVSILLVIAAVLVSIYNNRNRLNLSIPTPFGKWPFELTVGFRKSYLLLILSWFLTFQSIIVGNFNLGVFAIIVILGVVMTSFSKPENAYFVWNYSLSSHSFLVQKIKMGLLGFTFLSLPVLILLSYFFISQAYVLVVVLVVGYAYIVNIILAKYAAYPNEINLPESIILAISLFFPPLLLILIPYFYRKSIRKLSQILEND